MAKKEISKIKLTPKNRRLFILGIFFVCIALVILGRTLYIKIAKGDYYEKKVKSQQITVSEEALHALRGNIYDCTGAELVVSTRTYELFMDCNYLSTLSEKVQKSTARVLCDVLQIADVETILQYIKDNTDSQHFVFSQGEELTESVKERIQEEIDAGNCTGIYFEETTNRVYPNESLAAHILGFNGVYGVEQYYDEYLSGTDGRRMVLYDSSGDYTAQEVEAIDGCDLTLTINATVQSIMEAALLEGTTKYNSKEACAICMNPQTGEIYGWANVPTFNLADNTEVIGAGSKFVEAYSEDEYYQRVWNNYGLTFTYQPGSTYKPIFSSIALEEGTIGTGTTFTCKSSGHTIEDTTFECFEQQVHGTETVREILVNSCNQGMVQISETLSGSTYIKYQDAYGIGQLTGIDLAGEVDAANLVYTLDTLGPVEKATCAFGQGFNVTPIQLITAFSAVINGGELLQPYVVSKVTDSEGNVVLSNEKTVLRHTISEETSANMRSFLGSVISKTWGWYYVVDGYTFGGKTGTAQQGAYEKADDIVSFISFTSVDNPEVVLLVVMSADDDAQSSHAAEVSRNIMSQILPILGIYPE